MKEGTFINKFLSTVRLVSLGKCSFPNSGKIGLQARTTFLKERGPPILNFEIIYHWLTNENVAFLKSAKSRHN